MVNRSSLLSTLKLLIIFTLAFAQTATFADRPRPRQPEDYGLIYSQKASQYPLTKDDILITSRGALAADISVFQELDSSSAVQLLTQLPIAILTHLQKEWEGILMETFGEPVDEVEAYHPQGYIRGSVVFPIVSGRFGELRGVGPFDLKGSGLSVEGEEALRLYHSVIVYALGKKAWSAEASQSVAWMNIKRDLKEHRRELKEWLANRPELSSDPLQRRHHQMLLGQFRLKEKLADNLLVAINNLERTGQVPEARQKVIVETLRKMDYTNGLLSAPRALKEFLMAVGWNVYLARYNEKHGTNLSIVQPYAVTLLPANILLPNGKKVRAATLVRQTSWRKEVNAQTQEVWPNSIFNPVIGAIQSDIFDRMIDLECPALQVEGANLLKWDDFGGHPIEAEAEKAYTAFIAGDKKPLADLVRRVQEEARNAAVPDVVPPELARSLKVIQAHQWLEKLNGKAEMKLSHDDVVEIKSILDEKSVSHSERMALLVRVTSAAPETGIRILLEHFQKINGDLRSRIEKQGESRTPTKFKVDANEFIDALSVVITTWDPFHEALLSSPEEKRKLFELLLAMPGNFYQSILRDTPMIRRAYVSNAHRLNMDGFVYEINEGIWLVQQAVMIAMIELHRADLITPPGQALPDPIIHFPSLVRPLRLSEALDPIKSANQVLFLMILTAQQMVGSHFSERVMEQIDPGDISNMRTLRNHLATHVDELNRAITQLMTQTGVDRNCALNIVLGGLHR